MFARVAANAGGNGVGTRLLACGSTALAEEDDVPLVFIEAPWEFGPEYPVA